MTQLFLNTSIISNNSSFLGYLANQCLAPHRCLFHGWEVEIWNHIIIREDKSLKNHWTQSAFAILLYVPGILIGLAARILDVHLFSSTRADFAILEKFDQQPHCLAGNISLEVSHARLNKSAIAIKNRMTTKDIWKDSDFVSKVDEFMEAAHQEMNLFFKELEERYEKNPAKMAHAMAQEGPNTDNGPLYLLFYFYSSLTEMYHLARSQAYLEHHASSKNKRIVRHSSLTETDRQPYFTLNTPQFHWRELYNDFCNKLHQTEGLLDHLAKEDKRFIDWAEPDLEDFDKSDIPENHPSSSFFAIIDISM